MVLISEYCKGLAFTPIWDEKEIKNQKLLREAVGEVSVAQTF